MNKSYETTCVHSNMLKHTGHQSIFAQDNFTFLDPGTAELVSDWVCVVGWVGGGGGGGGGRAGLISISILGRKLKALFLTRSL